MTEKVPFKNLGARTVLRVHEPRFPNADDLVMERAIARKKESKVDVMLVNPPAPDGGIWIRSQHRVGRRSRENMIWPQVSLVQLAALLAPDYTVQVIDAIAERMGWKEFEEILRDRKPKFYLTQVTAPSLTNDMYGVMLAKSLGAHTLAFGTHVTPIPKNTLATFPALDYVLRGEPELTFRELVDTLSVESGRWVVDGGGQLCDPKTGEAPANHAAFMWKMWTDADPGWAPAWTKPTLSERLEAIKGLGWRRAGEVTLNADRPFVRDLDDLPMPLHHLLPWRKYRMPRVKSAYTFIVTSRGCPAGCKYCIKHVSYQNGLRLRSAKKLHEEIKLLYSLGIRHVHMYADLFTVNRDQVMELCNLLITQGPKITWTCNSRVDYVDEEMLDAMGKSGCFCIAWGIESANEQILKRAHKGYPLEQAPRALAQARKAGILNWGYFIIGLPGETEETIKQTMAYSKKLPLDIVLFHVAAPYPGTPFFFEVVENNWFRPGVNWEEVDMDEATVLDYPGMKAEELLKWQKRAFREWALRPGPIWFGIKSLNSWQGIKSAVSIGLQTLGWIGK